MPQLLSLIVPFYNEEDAIGIFAASVLPVLEAIPDLQWEIICVDDGSRDATLQHLLELAAAEPRIRVVELSRNFGKEAALTAGLEAARGDAVIPFDADLQDPPEMIPVMVTAWQSGAEVVLGRRTDRSTDTAMKRGTASLFYKLNRYISNIELPENVGDFRLMDRAVVEALKRLPERQRFMKGLFAWLGFKTAIIDYSRTPRAAGESKFSGFKLWNFALEGFTSFSTAPLKIWTYFGALGAVVALLYAVFIMLKTLFFGNEVPGYASIFVAVTFFGSVQLISIGVLGEYIGRIYVETKQRPIYLVRKLHNF
ncbi:MAG: glycosyltransferase family 2 protein [Rhodospirillales bacterium]|nr:glycosyltransferase family 2 protein [Rhodospirillales bacterium]